MAWFFLARPRSRVRWAARIALLLLAGGAAGWAQAQAPLTLPQAFERAWERRPEAQALPARRQAGEAQRRAAQGWTPAPAALEAAVQTDRFNRRQGAQEVEVGLAVPLWLPGERQRSLGLAEAQAQAVEAQTDSQRWQLAHTLRAQWWQTLREREDAQAAHERWQASQALAVDVARRVQAGDLSRADRHQADAAVASAWAEHLKAQAQAIASEQALRALLGVPSDEALPLSTAPEPEPTTAEAPPVHPVLAALEAKAQAQRSAAALAQTQSREHPEVTLLHTRDRAARGEARTGAVTLGLRWPLGGGERHRAVVAGALAEQTEAEVLLARERERLAAEQRSAQAALAAARAVLGAAAERARLTAETRDFFDKSFRLGETDLPTRLRVAQEASHAQRDLALARIDLNLAIAQARQSLGLLPQ